MGEKAKFNIKIITSQGTEDRCLEEDSFVVGRGLECSISLRHDKISRKHLQCTLKNDQIWIEDLGSSNGSYINEIMLAPHVPLQILGTEKIQVGNSDIFIFIQLNLPQVAAEPVIEAETPKKALVQNEKVPTTSEKIEIHGAVSPKLILKHARSKANTIVLEAETAAEKRVQEIYQRANESHKKAEEFYRKRMQTADDDAHKVLEEAGEEGRGLIVDARIRAQSIRDEVDQYAAELRKDTEEKCKSIAADAEQVMRLKEQQLLEKASKETKEKIDIELKVHHDDIADLQREIEELSIQAEKLKFLNDTANKEKEKIEKDIHELELQESELKKFTEHLNSVKASLKEELEDSEKKKAEHISQQTLLLENIKEKQKEKSRYDLEVSGLNKSIGVLSEKVVDLNSSLKVSEDECLQKSKELQALESRTDAANVAHGLAQKEVTQLQKEVELQKSLKDGYQTEQLKLTTTNEQSKKEVEKLSVHIHSLNEKLTSLTKQFEAENSAFKDKLETSKAHHEKFEEEYADKLRLQTSIKFSKMEAELLQQLHDKKELLSREIVLHAESILQADVPKDIWRQRAKELEKQAHLLLSGQVTTMNGKSVEPASDKNFILQKKREQQYRVLIGAVVGAVLVLTVQAAVVHVGSDKSPLQERAELASKEKLQDLQERRFEPKQVSALKENYTDAVIYTKNFSTTYLDSDYQKRWFSAATSYLLRTWRLDEAVSIQVLSTAAALVKGLGDRRQSIHPDFVKESILKMRELEKESTQRLVTTLGSEVRFESFKKFEKEFFEKELKSH